MIPTKEQIEKLPKWAQEHIRSVQMERDAAVRALNEFTDSQTPSRIWYEDYVCTGEGRGPSKKRSYIQAYAVNFGFNGGEGGVRVSLDLDDGDIIKVRSDWTRLYFNPMASNSIQIVREK